MAHFDDLFKIFTAHNLSCWVAGIDHDNCARAEAQILTLLDLLVESVSIETPAIGLVQIVGQQLASIQGQES